MMSDVESPPQKKAYRRVRTPTIIQIEATECGAVSLGIILAYYGSYVSIEELRIACGISRNGSSATNIIDAAASYHLEAEGVSCDMEALYEFDFPVILFWKFKHFLVLEGFNKDRFFVNDPATGPRSISYEDFDQSFTGIVISLKPLPTFVKQGSPPSLMDALYQRLKEVKRPLIYVALVGLCLVVPNLALPAVTQCFIDQVLVHHTTAWEVGIISILLLVIALNALLSFAQGQILRRLNARLSMWLGNHMLWHMLRLPMSFYTQRYPGEIGSRFILNDSVSDTITGELAITSVNVLFVFIYGIAMLYYDFLIATVAISTILLNLVVMSWVYRARSDAYACYRADLGKSNAYTLGALRNIETIKATGMEIKFFSLWVSYYTKVVNVLQEVGKKDALLTLSSSFLNFSVTLVLIAIGGWKMIHGKLTVGMFIALQILLRNFMSPVLQLIAFSQKIQLLKVDLARLDDVVLHPIDPLLIEKNDAEKEDQDSKEGGLSVFNLNGNIELRNISFQYSPRDNLILNDISFSLNQGKSIAIVGSSGCGKSTVAKLIAGLVSPTEGELLFDGLPRDKIPREIMTRSLSLIEQEPFLFQGTVKENLTMLDSLINDESIFRATKDACIHDEILSRPGGYDSEIKEQGFNLSGGQRQRLELARGLIKNPTILLLDESTSTLDSETEAEVIKNIKRRGCALLMIAHRLSTIRSCDEIIVMERGAISAAGTHEELKEMAGIYRDLIESEQTENESLS